MKVQSIHFSQDSFWPIWLYAAHVCIIYTELTGPGWHSDWSFKWPTGVSKCPKNLGSLARQAGSRGRVGHLHHPSLVVPGSQPVDPAECPGDGPEGELFSHWGACPSLRPDMRGKECLFLSKCCKGAWNHPWAQEASILLLTRRVYELLMWGRNVPSQGTVPNPGWSPSHTWHLPVPLFPSPSCNKG